MNRPKVLIIIATGVVGGPGKGLFQLIRNMPNPEFDYILCNFSVKGNKDYEFVTVANKNNINIKFLHQKNLLDISLVSQAYKLYKNEGCNIIQTHGYKSHLIGWFLKKLHNIKWVAVVNGWTNENYRIRIYNKLDRFVLRKADTVITVSPKLNDHVIKNIRPGKHTEMILNAVDEKEIITTEGTRILIENIVRRRKDEFVIGVFGRLSPEKGHAILLDSIKNVVNIYENINVIIAGDGPCKGFIEKKINELDIGKNVKLIGYQAGMRDLYNAIDLLVLPSLSEGLPNVVLEAMVLGKPVIATNVGGVSEIINDNLNGWIVNPGCSKAISDKIIEIIENPLLLNNVSLMVRDSLSPKFSPQTRAYKYLEVYRKLLIT